MIILHGVYDNGKIMIEEKDLPKLKSKVEIKILDDDLNESKEQLNFHKSKGKLLVDRLSREDYYED